MLLFQYCADVTTDNQEFFFGVPPTTAVTLQSFEARPSDSAVDLLWRTGSELDNLGFHLDRSLSETGPWTRLTASLVPGLGSSPIRATYSGGTRGSRTGRATSTDWGRRHEVGVDLPAVWAVRADSTWRNGGGTAEAEVAGRMRRLSAEGTSGRAAVLRDLRGLSVRGALRRSLIGSGASGVALAASGSGGP
jgi:hypothetical protein